MTYLPEAVGVNEYQTLSRGPTQSVGAHHAHVGPADRQDRRRAVRRGRHGGAEVLVLPRGASLQIEGRMGRRLRKRMPWQVGRQVRLRGDRADAGPTPAVRDAEGLVQVEMADVCTEAAGLRQTEQRIEVGAIHINLAARGMHQLTQLDDSFFEHPVGRWIGHHDRCQLITMLGDLGTKVVQVHRAISGCLDDHDLEASHGC